MHFRNCTFPTNAWKSAVWLSQRRREERIEKDRTGSSEHGTIVCRQVVGENAKDLEIKRDVTDGRWIVSEISIVASQATESTIRRIVNLNSSGLHRVSKLFDSNNHGETNGEQKRSQYLDRYRAYTLFHDVSMYSLTYLLNSHTLFDHELLHPDFYILPD